MFCSKCHTEIREEDIYFCPRCGQKIENKKTNNHFYFSPKIKSISNEHEEQYSYSKEYSNVKNDTLEDHQKGNVKVLLLQIRPDKLHVSCPIASSL